MQLIETSFSNKLLAKTHASNSAQADATLGQWLRPNLLHLQPHNGPTCPDRGVLINGVTGLMNNESAVMTRESFSNYINLGGYDYIGRGPDELRTVEQKQKALEVATNLGLTGLILVGATATMTDALYLAEHFEASGSSIKVVAVPATVDGNIHHNYI